MARPDELLDPRRSDTEPHTPVVIDRARYPHYGGRKRPAECSVCHRTLLTLQVDTLEGDGEDICPQCITVAIDVGWSDARIQMEKHGRVDAMWAYDTEQCPSRGEGYRHGSDGRYNCAYCGVRLYPAPRPTTAYADQDCPKRGPSLKHTTDGGKTCVHCGVRVLRRGRSQ